MKLLIYIFVYFMFQFLAIFGCDSKHSVELQAAIISRPIIKSASSTSLNNLSAIPNDSHLTKDTEQLSDNNVQIYPKSRLSASPAGIHNTSHSARASAYGFKSSLPVIYEVFQEDDEAAQTEFDEKERHCARKLAQIYLVGRNKHALPIKPDPLLILKNRHREFKKANPLPNPENKYHQTVTETAIIVAHQIQTQAPEHLNSAITLEPPVSSAHTEPAQPQNSSRRKKLRRYDNQSRQPYLLQLARTRQISMRVPRRKKSKKSLACCAVM